MSALTKLTEVARLAINRIAMFSEKEKRQIHVALDSTTEQAETYADAAISAHEAAADPHTGYLKESTLTTKGDILGFSIENIRVPVGTDDYVLTADSTEDAGIAWKAASGGGSGDLLADGSVPVDSYLDWTPGAAPAWAEGRVFYDSTDHALSYYNEEADVTVNVAEENLVRVRNASGVAIGDGDVVYISGSTGEVPQVTKAIATSAHVKMLGVATHSIENNSFGYITTFGIVRGVDMSSFSAGDILYLDDFVAGGLTNVKPSWPVEAVEIGTVIKNTVSGKLFVSIDHVYLHELSDDAAPYLGGHLDVNGFDLVAYAGDNINLTPYDAGVVVIDGLTWPSADGTANYVLETDGAGNLGWTPQTGGGTVAQSGHASISVQSNVTTTTFSGSSSDFTNKSQITVFDTNGAAAQDVTPDHTNDHLTVDVAGTYAVYADISFSGGSTDTYSFALFKNNGATQLGARTTRKMGTGGDVGAAPALAIVDLEVNDTVEVWIQNESSTGAATVQDAVLAVAGVGGMASLVEDTTPQLGGNLDINGKSIVSVSNGDIAITPNGTGDLILDGLKWPQSDGTADYLLKTDGAGQLSWVSSAGGGSVNFTDLDDTPGSYSGQANKWLKVNASATALEFTSSPVQAITATAPVAKSGTTTVNISMPAAAGPSTDGYMTGEDKDKLDNIEAQADKTDAGNVEAALSSTDGTVDVTGADLAVLGVDGVKVSVSATEPLSPSTNDVGIDIS
jgi:hypothetical protein